ncbi:MAG: aminotransferase class I/II-fold pyridoxal phosphate-dependent enzyme, partial [Candidatus Omnitrophota bacterium]|nr:aminotransferase class I/II-fold pyridoxal phosphate-dependent enzyme [Candidatus Omnitrophota bacterium]
GTFSKALGSFGAYAACSSQLKNYLINSSRSFIYSTSLPPPVIGASLAGLDLIKKEPFRRKILLEKSNYFRDELNKRGFSVRGSSQIIPLILGDNRKAAKTSEELRNRGYWVLPIMPPTVPKNESRLRFSLSYCHTKDMLKGLLDALSEIEHVYPV